MTVLLFGALWVHLAAGVLLTGATFILLLAGPPPNAAMQRWEHRVVSASRWLVLVALLSGVAWLSARTALFEGRPEAALEPRAVWNAMVHTWPGQVWMTRHGLLIVLAVFLFLLPSGHLLQGRNWLAARGEAFLLSAFVLVLVSSSSHVAAVSAELWPQALDMLHLLAAGVWVGGVPPVAYLLHAASRDATAPDPFAVRAMQRFSRVALAAVLVLAGTGTATAWMLVGGLAGFVGTAYGHLLLVKLAVLVPVLLLAGVNRFLLPALVGPDNVRRVATARRMALFIAVEAALALLLLGLGAAMTITTPARHDDPVWPWPVRLSLDGIADVSVWRVFASAPAGAALIGAGLVLLAAFAFLRRRPPLLAAGLAGLAAGIGVVVVPHMVVEAYPTSFIRPPVAYHAGSIAQGMATYRTHCASCHEPQQAGREIVDLGAPLTARRSAGDLFWLTTHGDPERGMPEFGSRLADTERWDVISFFRASSAAAEAHRLGPEVDFDNAWLTAPDLTISIGPIAPWGLRDYRGRRMVLLVLYDLPGSRERMTELARRYAMLSVLGVEVVAVPFRNASDALAELGGPRPVLFPVVTAGNEEIVTAYGLFAPDDRHVELLIDRQGYIRAIWRSRQSGAPDGAAILAQVERLNQEKPPPALPEDHFH